MNSRNGHVTKETDGYKVVFHRTYYHPIEKVWLAITDPDQMKYWFTDIEMDFREGGEMKIIFRDEKKSGSQGRIIRISEPELFEWEWEGELAVWQLKKIDDQSTALTFTYSRLNKDYAVNAPAGFHSLLDLLEARLNGSTEIYAFGAETNDPEQEKLKTLYAANIFEQAPEVVKSEPVVVEKTYKATVDKVWKALTDQGQMKEWYFDVDGFEAREGFEFSFTGQGRKGEKYVHHCRILEIVPNKKLQYSWAYEGMEGYSVVTFLLSGTGDQTQVRLTHHGLESFKDGGADFARESFNEGWNHIIGKSLLQYVQK